MLQSYFSQLNLPRKNSHKGQNGKLLLIGGSELFHAASKWSLDVASKIVDMVFYSSVASNNELIQKAKSEFWNGIVIPREHLEEYVAEADCILIGPGMERNQETEELVNYLLTKYSEKKCVIDAGALQMVDPKLLNHKHILTPHQKEMEHLQQRATDTKISLDETQVTILQKGVVDTVSWFEADEAETKSTGTSAFEMTEVSQVTGKAQTTEKSKIQIAGGNEGMTKGGTGDVLAGLVAALYCTNHAHISAIVASTVNKQAGDQLYKTVGPFFNASDLVEQVPKTLWQLVK